MTKKKFFFRLIRPDEKPRKGFLHWGSGKFSYQGRTQFQSKMASQMFGNSAPNIQRSQSARFSCKSDGNGAFFNLLPMLEIYIESENFLLIKSISHNTSHFIEFNLQWLNFLWSKYHNFKIIFFKNEVCMWVSFYA